MLELELSDRLRHSPIVVTGGAGFIGGHVVDCLLEHRAHDVLVIDDFSRGSHVAGGNSRVRVFDLASEVPILPKDAVVFHLAAKVTGIQYNIKHHLEMLSANTRIALNMAEAAATHSPKLFINVSTACVYPHDAPVPTPERYADTCNPEPTNHGYGVAKWVGEQATRYLREQHGIPSFSVRFFNAFGPRDYYDDETSHVAPALIKRVLSGENPLEVWGTGTQTRSLVDARDIARVLVMLADRALHDAANLPATAFPQVVNIGHSNEVCIVSLAKAIIAATGVCPKPQIVFDASYPDGYPRRAADTTLLDSLIGSFPWTPLDTTLTDMVSDYRNRELHPQREVDNARG